jgi:hypothetical protein
MLRLVSGVQGMTGMMVVIFAKLLSQKIGEWEGETRKMCLFKTAIEGIYIVRREPRKFFIFSGHRVFIHDSILPAKPFHLVPCLDVANRGAVKQLSS